MKGLILKDLYMAFRYCRFLFIVSAVMITASVLAPEGEGTFFAVFPAILCATIPMTLISYDDLSKWSRYVGTLPCTRAQIVSARFIVALIIQGSTLLLIAVILSAGMILRDGFSLGGLLNSLALPFILIGLYSLSMPLVHHFGVEKGRTIYLLFTGGLAGITAFFVSSMSDSAKSADIPGGALAIACVAAAAVYGLSWILSVAVYRKKELV